MPGIARELLLSALAAKQNHLQVIFSLPNVIACGVGYKVASNGPTGDLAVVVSVTRKIPEALLSAAELIPRVIDGIKTDVIETGIFHAFQGARDRWRPVIPPGVSLGHVNTTAGTFGCLVQREDEIFILSNNHVLANANQGKAGDPIIQPGRLDGGSPQDRIATLADYIPLDFGDDTATCNLARGAEKTLNTLSSMFGSQHRLLAYQQTQGLNRVDAALARPDEPACVTPDIVGIGRPLGTRRATLGTRVKKSGRSTGTTEGRIIQVDVTSQVSYGPAQARFYGQLMATGMSQAGDSGSAVLDMENYVVGLLFAGSDNATLITPIQPVLEALHVEMVT